MKRPEFKAYEVSALLAAIVDSSDDAIVSKTLEGIITSWNHGAEKIFGYSAAEAIGQHITFIIPPSVIRKKIDVLAQIRRGEKVDHFETIRQTKDGRRVEIYANGFTGPETPRVGSSGHQKSPVTSHYASRQTINGAIDGCGRRGPRNAEEANRLKDDFLATVSHELRNPLNSIVGWAGLLSGGRLDEKKTDRALDAINRAAQAQDQEFISDLLDVSRIISGRLRLDIRPLRLIEVLETAIDTVRPPRTARRFGCSRCLTLERAQWRAILIACGRSSGICYPMRLSSRPETDAFKSVRADRRSTSRFLVADTGSGLSHRWFPSYSIAFGSGGSGH